MVRSVIKPNQARASGPPLELKMTKFAVLLDGENVWTIDGAPWLFDTFEAAAAELDETFREMDDAGMDYEPSEYRIEEVNHV